MDGRCNTPSGGSPVCVELICVVEEVEGGDVGVGGAVDGFLLEHFRHRRSKGVISVECLKQKKKKRVCEFTNL